MKSDNELIAEFMGLIPEVAKRPWGINIFEKRENVTFWCKSPGGFGVASKALKYDRSWDWLIPVVERMEGLGCDIAIYYRATSILNKELGYNEEWIGTTETQKIYCTYKAVVAFIKWYNTLPKQ